MARNPLTGRKRKRSRRNTSRKKRATTSSTVGERMYSQIAIQALALYMRCVSIHFEIASLFLAFAAGVAEDYTKFFAAIALQYLKKGIFAFEMAILCAQLDADLLDYDENAVNSGYRYPLNPNLRIDRMFRNDDEADQFTRFKKHELRSLLVSFDLPEIIWVPQNPHRITGKYHQFHREELLIYMLHRMVSSSTHKSAADSPIFGGTLSRWSKGYCWLVMYLDDRYFPLIGPDAVRMWVPHFPSFARRIWDYLAKPKHRYYDDGQHYRIVRWNHPGAPGRNELNIAGFMDCKIYQCCRPGSGPDGDYDDAPRRPNAYIKQRAFYDGHHRCHAIKILTIYLPNGMTAAVYGPTSARGKDPTLLEWSDFDNALRDECLHHFPNRLYTVYADSIFRGYWHCVRTRHEPLQQLGIPLTWAQQNENDNLKSARVAVELGYGRASQLFPILEVRDYRKLEVDANLVYAQTRVVHFLSNVVTCLREGSTCTGQRMFKCPPPTLENYLNGMHA